MHNLGVVSGSHMCNLWMLDCLPRRMGAIPVQSHQGFAAHPLQQLQNGQPERPNAGTVCLYRTKCKK